MKSLAEITLSHRKKAGLSQARLASLAGVGKTVIWDIEHGKESVGWDTLNKIFRVLNITVEWHSPMIERTVSVPQPPLPSTSSSSSAPN